jgi:hypothetical protein
MTRRFWLWLGGSLGLNGVLALACWHLWTAPETEAVLLTPLPPPVSRLEPPPPVAIEEPATRAGVGMGTAVLVAWSDLASADFFEYRDNLLAIGCPERTVRNILDSELDRWFLERRRPILEAVQRDFWERAAQGGMGGFDEVMTGLNRLWQERNELLLAVLGEPEPDRVFQLGRRKEWFVQRHHWLPDDVQARLFELDEKHEQAERAWADEIRARPDPQGTAEDHVRHQELQAEYEANRHAALGDWADEFEFRDSRRAQWAGLLVGFEPTEVEWRAVTQAGLDLDAELRRTGPGVGVLLMMERYGIAPESSPEDLQAIADGKARYELNVQAALGPERFAEYQRAGDPDFRQTWEVTQRLALADDVAIQAWEIQRSTRIAADELRASMAMDDARRHAALEEIHAETSRSLRAALGERGYGIYTEHAGAWLGQLVPGE